jgi:hypothetical protein
VLTIPLQNRPVYLKSDFAYLKANTVYIRRGSSTDEAAPDEVIRMTANTGVPLGQPVLQLQLCDLVTRQKFGETATASPQLLQIPDHALIPFYGKSPDRLWGMSFGTEAAFQNREYYREVAEYLEVEALWYPAGLAINNPSTNVAENVIVTVEIDGCDTLYLVDSLSMPIFPTTNTLHAKVPAFPMIKPRTVCVARYGNNFEIQVLFGTVQPGRTVWVDEPFFITAGVACEVKLNTTTSANNLLIPLVSELTVQIQPVAKTIDVPEIVRRGNERL